jgi:glutamate N-acetyltransferase/amino-acid N-acetyltransferase
MNSCLEELLMIQSDIKQIEGGVTATRGFKAFGVESGIKKAGGLDLALVYSETGSTAAGVFTTNKVVAAPVMVSRNHLKKGEPRAVIINSGNANACLGEAGMKAAQSMAAITAETLGLASEDVLVASTGVIGAAFPIERVIAAIKPLVEGLSPMGGNTAARAIMTTDTVSKEYAVEITLDGKPVRVGGMAKGSGMIQPNMATMLSVVTTDLELPSGLLHRALAAATRVSFNRITVDGDTSTNDSLFAIANGASGVKVDSIGLEFDKFQQALSTVCEELAKMCVKDGEGATKFITVRVEGAPDDESAEKAARAVANSSLVKTAFFGEDANWGRILCAVGYSGIEFDPQATSICLGDLIVYENGTGLFFSESQVAQILAEREIAVTIQVGRGPGSASVWTCDLSYDYVKINGSYRT